MNAEQPTLFNFCIMAEEDFLDIMCNNYHVLLCCTLRVQRPFLGLPQIPVSGLAGSVLWRGKNS